MKKSQIDELCGLRQIAVMSALCCGLKIHKKENVFTAALYYSHHVISFALYREHRENSLLNKYSAFFIWQY